MAPEQVQLVGEEGDVQERNDGFGRAERERAEPRALTTGEDDRAYLAPVQGSASLISMTGMPSRTG